MSSPVRRLLQAGILVLLAWGCVGGRKAEEGSTEDRFDRGMTLYEKEKWSRAADEFNWVVINNPAGVLAAEAQYYYAECIYQQKQFVEAQLEFERLLRRWSTTKHQVQARYRICQSLVAQSPPYYHDQGATEDAIDELQEFIEDFPDNPYNDEAEGLINKLRHKLAHKYYESGRLYLKWDRTSSARLYFGRVLAQYYDTSYADEARVAMIISYLLEKDLDAAQAYLEENKENFADRKYQQEAEGFIEMTRQDKFDLSFFTRLYR